MGLQIEAFEERANPLDCVEDVLASHNWVFNRMNDDELTVQITGKSCDYRLFFIWQDDLNALQLCVQYDMVVTPQNMKNAADILMQLNENLWMGHFDIPKETSTPTFRQTSLLRGLNREDSSETIEDLVDISLAQCERYQSIFHFLCTTTVANDQTLSLALMDTSGEA